MGDGRFALYRRAVYGLIICSKKLRAVEQIHVITIRKAVAWGSIVVKALRY
jgi:hypothetical protein